MSSIIESGQRLTKGTKIIALIFVGVFIVAAIYYFQNRPKRDEVIPCSGWQHDAGSISPPTAPITPNGTPLTGLLSSSQSRRRC